jgi:hypothetical protein
MWSLRILARQYIIIHIGLMPRNRTRLPVTLSPAWRRREAAVLFT